MVSEVHGLFRPVFSIVQTGVHWSASALFTLTGDVAKLAIPSQFRPLDRGMEWFLPASVVGDLLSDELIRPVLCV